MVEFALKPGRQVMFITSRLLPRKACWKPATTWRPVPARGGLDGARWPRLLSPWWAPPGPC